MSKKILEGLRDQEGKYMDACHARKPFAEPKLTFIEPKLTKHGGCNQDYGSVLWYFYTVGITRVAVRWIERERNPTVN